MKRTKQVRLDESRDEPWLWVVGEAGAANGEAWAKAAVALLLAAWTESAKQASRDGFTVDDAEDIASIASLALMKQLVKDPGLLNRPKEVERRRSNITKTQIYNWQGELIASAAIIPTSSIGSLQAWTPVDAANHSTFHQGTARMFRAIHEVRVPVCMSSPAFARPG